MLLYVNILKIENSSYTPFKNYYNPKMPRVNNRKPDKLNSFLNKFFWFSMNFNIVSILSNAKSVDNSIWEERYYV